MYAHSLLSARARRRVSALPRRSLVAGGLLGVLGLLGCHELTGDQPLPAGTESPGYYNTQTGALGMRNAAIYALESELTSYVIDAGLLTDELESNQVGASPGVLSESSLPAGGSLDERILPENDNFGEIASAGSGDYSNLQTVRADANQALGALATYDTTAPPAMRGELYALQGYAEILLADLFCSGVPLSTLDYNQNFTYHASSTTAQVYQDALAKLDTALALSSDSARIMNLARVLKGRAYLDLGQYDSAAVAVAAVQDGFQYQLSISWEEPTGSINILNGQATVSDREGQNGLPFIASGDPRTAVEVIPNTSTLNIATTLYFPDRYQAGLSGSGLTPFTVADWIEARLIRAEAALQAGDPTTWLTQLNVLRETATAPGQTTALQDTTDPGTDTARVSLLFQERAYWLFLTGHRQGDLRRLIRDYGRDPDTVYPTGVYTAPGTGQYGEDVTAPIPATEDPNPLFHGCLDRNA